VLIHRIHLRQGQHRSTAADRVGYYEISHEGVIYVVGSISIRDKTEKRPDSATLRADSARRDRPFYLRRTSRAGRTSDGEYDRGTAVFALTLTPPTRRSLHPIKHSCVPSFCNPSRLVGENHRPRYAPSDDARPGAVRTGHAVSARDRLQNHSSHIVSAGEIDIIARDGIRSFFVEVKTRAYDDPTPRSRSQVSKHQITKAAKNVSESAMAHRNLRPV